MTPEERFTRANRLAEEALGLPPDGREAFLNASCAVDDELRREVEALLVDAGTAGELLERPVGPRAGPTLEQRIGPWRLVSELGRGGMSVVFLARRADGAYRQEAAVKLLFQSAFAPDLERRFRTERQILAGLAHPNIAHLLDGGTTEDGTPYLVMERVEGKHLDRYCDGHRLGLRRRLEIFLTVCATVQHAHRNLVVHRDLKPSRVLVTGAGEPKLLDFGIAKLLDPQPPGEPTEPTAAWARRLSPHYASPEQVRGENVTTASDVYSLGVVLYQLLSGELPHRFDGLAPARIEKIISTRRPPAASTVLTAEAAAARNGTVQHLRRRLAGDLDAIVLKALRPEPMERYGSAEQLAEDLRRHLAGLPVGARRGTLRYRTGKFLRRHRWAALAGAIVGIMALAFVFSTLHQNRLITAQQELALAQRDAAEREREKARRLSNLLSGVFEVADPGGAGARTFSARELLDQAKPRILEELAEEPELRALTLDRLGGIYRNLGDFEEAEELLATALALQRRHLPVGHPDTADTLNDLSILRHFQGEYADCVAAAQEALDIRRAHADAAGEPAAESLYFLSICLHGTGRFEEAEAAAVESLQIRRRLPRNEPMIAQSLNQLGQVKIALGDLASAGPLYEEALAIRRQVLGESHALVAETLNDLGVLKSRLGDREQAARLLRQALAIDREVLGEGHPVAINIKSSLAANLMELDALDEAEALIREVLAHRRSTLPPGHPWISHGYLILGRIQHRKGAFKEAEAAYRQGAANCPQSGQRHPLCAFPVLGRAQLARDQGQVVAARRIVEQLLEEWRELVPAGHRLIVQAEELLAEVTLERG